MYSQDEFNETEPFFSGSDDVGDAFSNMYHSFVKWAKYTEDDLVILLEWLEDQCKILSTSPNATEYQFNDNEYQFRLLRL
jgi:hypothetical protein